jgi:hypothetical protein
MHPPDIQVPSDQAATSRLARQSRQLRAAAMVVLVPVALIGAALSFHSIYDAAVPIFGVNLAVGAPAVVDLLVLGASLQYVAGAKIGRPLPGWKLTAYGGIAASLTLNALAAAQLGDVPWHVFAPAIWAILVELTAAEVLGEFEAVQHGSTARIPLTLWLTDPGDSARTKVLMLRTGLRDATEARTAVGVNAAAREALRLALPYWRGRRVRRIIHRQLRTGSLPPAAILGPLGWDDDSATVPNTPAGRILREVLQGVLDLNSDAAADIVSVATSTRLMAAEP